MAGDTIVLSTADREGNMVSWVNSNFAGFGSGLTVPGYGFVLHNRGALFTLDPHSPNVIAPHKRPFNTLSAGLLMQEGRPVMTVTLMGGDMQAQGHAQLLVERHRSRRQPAGCSGHGTLPAQSDPQRAGLETPLYELLGSKLAAMGHSVKSIDGDAVGGVQAIMFVPANGANSTAAAAAADAVNGYYRSGSDFRKDGQAAGW